jgi:hypothetical protein
LKKGDRFFGAIVFFVEFDPPNPLGKGGPEKRREEKRRMEN